MASSNFDFQSYYDRYIDSLKQKVSVAVNQALKQTWADFFVIVDEKIHIMFESVIQDFYSSYSPHEYNRSESMYSLLQTSVQDDSLSIWFEPSNMSPYRSGYSGEDGLYDLVFRRGVHGGASSGPGHPSTGTPYWRRPKPYYSRWGVAAAVATVAPLDEMRLRVEEYERTEMQSDFDKIWSMHVGNIRIS